MPLALVVVALLTIAVCGLNHYATVRARIRAFNSVRYNRKSIRGGASGGDGIADIEDSDGRIGNPAKYPSNACELPNYLSKNGQIVAVAANGTEVPISIKGVNWFGMETYVWTQSTNVTAGLTLLTD